MRESYEVLDIKIILFDCSDVILTSDDPTLPKIQDMDED